MARKNKFFTMDAYSGPIKIQRGSSDVVTVIIAARNAQLWITDCLLSIRQQALPLDMKIQVIVGVDACQETLRTILNMDWVELTILYFPEWCGPYKIFNTCVKYAKGDLLFRFDADDVMLPGYIAAQLILFSRPDISIVRTWSIHADINLTPTRALLSNGSTTGYDGTLRRGTDGQFAMRREVWERLGGFESWQCFGDTEFLTRAKITGFKIAEVFDYLYLRRIHPSSLTGSSMTGYTSAIRKSYKEEVQKIKDLWILSDTVPPKLSPEIAIHKIVRGH